MFTMDEGIWENLKSACPGGAPAGENCEYHPEFLELMQLAAPRPELEMGSAIIAARLPDWPSMLQLSSSLAQRSRDLRVGVILTESLAQLNGWSGLADGLEVLEHWTTQLWSDVHPELDRLENDDPTARLSALAYLISDAFLSRTLQQLPLAEHAALGTLRLRDTLAIHKGKQQLHRELTSGELEAFFVDSGALTLAIRARDIDRCVTSLQAIDQFLNAQRGTDGWSAARTLQLLVRAREIMFKHLANHQDLGASTAGVQTIDVAPPVATVHNSKHISEHNSEPSGNLATCLPFQGLDSPLDLATTQVTSRAAETQLSASSLTGDRLIIGSRGEATAAIDAVCAYFQIHEPASPVPLLLQRAKRLISMNFIELMHELAPNEALQLLRQLHVVDKAG